MNQYKIITDFCSDLTLEMAEKLDVEIIPMEVVFDGEAPVSGFDIEVSEFYAKLRAKQSAQTSAANLDSFINTFEKYLAEGQDIIYIGIAAGLSCTFASAKLAASELSEKYPERKIYLVNSRSGSIGEGLIVHFAAQKKAEGLTARENYNYLKNLVKNFHSEFTLNDLFFLKRGGRVSGATALLGTMLAIKPVLHVDDEGHLINVEKAKGRKKAIQALLDHMKATAINVQEQTIFISHGDCAEEANALAEQIKAELGVKEVLVSYIGPVIGAHSGPGTVALFFLGTER
jgi:DegV family protein with EDD domain